MAASEKKKMHWANQSFEGEIKKESLVRARKIETEKLPQKLHIFSPKTDKALAKLLLAQGFRTARRN